MAGTLETLLERIRDGHATPDEIAHARDLVAGDARLPDELREVALTDTDDLPGDAVGLLAVLGADPLFGEALRDAVASDGVEVAGIEEADSAWQAIADVLREELQAVGEGFEVADSVMMRLPPAWAYGPVTAEAVLGEAGEVDVAGEAMAALGAAPSLVAEAVAFEAGPVDVTAAVAAALGHAAPLPVAEAVRAEAGEVDVAGSVLAQLDEVALPLAEAVASEGGTVDVARAVLAQLDEAVLPIAEAVGEEAGEIDVVGDVFATLGLESKATRPTLPAAVVAPPEVPAAPANRGWALGAVVMAAVALLVLGVTQTPGGVGGTMPGVASEIVFAAAGDVVVEDLDYADDVVVMQAEGDEGAVILWMEDA